MSCSEDSCGLPVLGAGAGPGALGASVSHTSLLYFFHLPGFPPMLPSCYFGRGHSPSPGSSRRKAPKTEVQGTVGHETEQEVKRQAFTGS